MNCPECKTPYESACGGPVAFLCGNPDCSLYNRIGIPSHEDVNPNDYVWLGIAREPHKKA